MFSRSSSGLSALQPCVLSNRAFLRHLFASCNFHWTRVVVILLPLFRDRWSHALRQSPSIFAVPIPSLCRFLNRSDTYLACISFIVFSIARFIASKTSSGLVHCCDNWWVEARKEFVRCIELVASTICTLLLRRARIEK